MPSLRSGITSGLGLCIRPYRYASQLVRRYYYMATHPALLSRNAIGWSSGRIAPSCPMDSAAKQNWKRMFNKIVSNFRETSESYKTWEKAFNKTRERLFFGEFSASFRTVFGKFENQQKTLGKWFWTNFVKIFFSENCRLMFRIFSFLPYNTLSINRTARAVPWNTKSSSFTHGPRKLGPYFKTSGLVFHGTALASG